MATTTTIKVTVGNSPTQPTQQIFFFDGKPAPVITFLEGATYIFDQSDSSNAPHPLRFSLTQDGEHHNPPGIDFSEGVTITGTQGQPGATVTLSVPNNLQDILQGHLLYYFCDIHSGFGSTGGLVIASNGADNLIGTGVNDLLQGFAGNDTLRGREGNDILNGGKGGDRLIGGQGNDTYYVDNTADVVVESLNQGTDTVISSISYTLANQIENLTLSGSANLNGTGNGLNNRITGNSGNNRLNGGTGNDILNGGKGGDRLMGGAGGDTLIGGLGNDTLTGGTGNDFFRFNLPSERIDRLTDFNVTDDTILISRSGFGGGLVTGTLPATRFTVGSSATTSAHRFFYNSDNGGLFFDVDGSGATAAVRIATLDTGLALTNADFVVV